ncbi:hypothetical protein AUC31_03825 [Planococcus rifietoensis]|uniref:Uncharacterized protein n=1 Tax=Planococcus rifietoensis TaxID=200991 RepID=A0A0U2N3U6_9BACL|nr:hypothetical protein AUC31_03825 [Planococcus rifietoensis]
MGMETATPAGAVTEPCDGATRAEDPGLSAAREAAEAVPAESVRRNGHLPSLLDPKKGLHKKRMFHAP